MGASASGGAPGSDGGGEVDIMPCDADADADAGTLRRVAVGRCM